MLLPVLSIAGCGSGGDSGSDCRGIAGNAGASDALVLLSREVNCVTTPCNDQIVTQTQPQSDGSFFFTDLEAGTYIIRVLRPQPLNANQQPYYNGLYLHSEGRAVLPDACGSAVL